LDRTIPMEPVGFQISWPSNQVNSGAINAAWTLFDAGRQQPRPPKSWRPKLQPRSERTAAFFGSGKERKIRFLILRMCGGRMSECPLGPKADIHSMGRAWEGATWRRLPAPLLP